MEKIRTVPHSYRTLTGSKVLTLDKFLADIATCEEFLARTPAPGDLTARGKSSPRGEGNRAIGLQEQQNVALYNPQQETFSARFSLMVQAPDTPAVQFLSEVQKLMAVHQVMLTTDYARKTVSKLGNEFLRDSVWTDLRSFQKDNPETDTVTFSLLRRFIETWEANHPRQMQTYSKDLSQHSPPHRLDKRFSRQLADVPRDRTDALSQDGSSPRTPHRDEEQSVSRRLTAPVECDESPHDNTTDTTTEYFDVLYRDLQGLPIAHRFNNPALFVQNPQPLPVASVECDNNPHKTDTAMTAAITTRTKSGRPVKNPLARDSSVPNTSTQPPGESRHETMDSSTGTNTPDTAAKSTTRTDARTEVPTHTAASMDTTRTVQDTPAQVRKAAQPSRTSARTKRNPACTVAATTGTVSATITRTSTRSGRFSREDYAPASTDASTNTSARRASAMEKSGTRFGTPAAHTRTQFPGSQQAHGIRAVPDPTPSAAASSADDTVQEPPVPPKPPDLFQRQAAPHNDYG